MVGYVEIIRERLENLIVGCLSPESLNLRSMVTLWSTNFGSFAGLWPLSPLSFSSFVFSTQCSKALLCNERIGSQLSGQSQYTKCFGTLSCKNCIRWESTTKSSNLRKDFQTLLSMCNETQVKKHCSLDPFLTSSIQFWLPPCDFFSLVSGHCCQERGKSSEVKTYGI